MVTWIVQREPTVQGVTPGTLDLGSGRFCYTLEDAVREQVGVPVADWKIAGATAIPAGTYALQITHSQRFGRPLPLLIGVPGFAGVRIHAGNTAADTEGCLLVGRTRVGATRIGESRAMCEELLARLARALRVMDVQLEIRPARHTPMTDLRDA